VSRLALLLLVLLVAPRAAAAQGATDDGVVRLRTGYTPDPRLRTARTVSTTPLADRARACRGFVGDAPDHVLELESEFGFLRLFTVAAADLTLAVRGPGGGWRCATGRSDRPALLEGEWEPGRYEVWVGSPRRDEPVEYELSITEFRSVGPGDESGRSGSIDVGLDVAAEEGRYRDRRIRRGFLPDPRVDDGVAEGTIDVRLLGPLCQGLTAAAPSHVMTLRNEFDYLRVQLGGAEGQTGIVLRTPGGRYLCSAPDEGNAFVDQDAWPEGEYRIWISTLVPDAEPAYHLCYTEARLSEQNATCSPAVADDRNDDEPE